MDKFEIKITLLFIVAMGTIIHMFSGLYDIYSVTVGIFSILFIQWFGKLITKPQPPKEANHDPRRQKK